MQKQRNTSNELNKKLNIIQNCEKWMTFLVAHSKCKLLRGKQILDVFINVPVLSCHGNCWKVGDVVVTFTVAVLALEPVSINGREGICHYSIWMGAVIGL